MTDEVRRNIGHRGRFGRGPPGLPADEHAGQLRAAAGAAGRVRRRGCLADPEGRRKEDTVYTGWGRSPRVLSSPLPSVSMKVVLRILRLQCSRSLAKHVEYLDNMFAKCVLHIG